MNKHYFNPKKKRKDPSVQNEKRRLNNEAVRKSITRGVYKKPHGKETRD
jgi:hypothetical protein